MKSFIKKLMGTKTYPDIKSIKPFTKIEGVPKYQKEIIKARGNVQKKFGSVNEGIKNETRQLRNVLQKMRGEKVTKSGISKGKDVTPGVYKPLKDKKKTDLATGGRVGRRCDRDWETEEKKMALHHTKYKQNYKQYILECLKTEDAFIGKQPTEDELIKYLFDRFYSEYGWLMERVGKQEAPPDRDWETF